VNFGIPATHCNPSNAAAHDPQRLLGVVRHAAQRLVANLEQACRLTGHWSNAAQTAALVDGALANCMQALADTGCVGEANRLPSNELWQIAGHRLEVGWLQHRARFKPRGYAGDYELLERICAQKCCADPLGQAFDAYFQRQAAPHAVRCRTQAVAAAIVAQGLTRVSLPFRVVSVGSGPAQDVYQALAVLPESRRQSMQVVLLDLDPDALDFARRRLAPLLPQAALHCLHENLSRLPVRPKKAQLLAAADVLVCTGLFDYLDDASAVAMLRLFWQQLAPAGLMLVGNFAPHNPTRAYMEWIGNWYLIYRTRQQMIDLALQAGIRTEHFAIAAEPMGVDLFLSARK